jgi:branched-chain amino acid transport system substrate-binding protein
MKEGRHRMTRRSFLKTAALGSAGAGLAGLTFKQTTWAAATRPREILFGAPYAMTGPDAMAQLQNVQGVNVALDIVNNYHDVDLPLARGEGLPNLGGAKMRVIYSDTLGLPEKGASETERMITQEKVTWITGGQKSSVVATMAQVCERYEVPNMYGEPSSPSLHTRGFKWFFRTGPHDVMFTQAIMEFLAELRDKRGQAIKTLALLYEDTLFGSDSATAQRQLAPKYGFQIVEDIKYRAQTSSLVSEIQRLKAARPDVLLPTGYTTDAILTIKTLKEQNWIPKIIIAQDAGYLDNAYIEQLGPDALYTASRSGFDYDLGTQRPSVKYVMDLYLKTAGYPMVETAAKTFTGVVCMCDAINRAGSTKNIDIQAALQKYELPIEQSIMPWKGIKINPQTGQNDLASGIIVQLFQPPAGAAPKTPNQFYSVWPFGTAAKEVKFPVSGWTTPR